MAGVALFISKNPQDNPLTALGEKLRPYIAENFEPHFERVSLEMPHPGQLLIQFRKSGGDEARKFYKDKQGNWLAFSGHVFMLHETKMLNAKELWELYCSQKEKLSNLLDGHFVIKLFDKAANKIVVFNDFFKNRTEFFTETDDCFLYTPFSLLSAAIREPQLDLYAFNEFLWRYYIQSNRSMLKDVRRLELAEWNEVSGATLTKSSYWKWPEKYTELSFDEAAQKLSESMKESARLVKQFSQKPIVELTMGQDSRQVAAGFTNQEIPFCSAIYGKDDFHEVAALKERTARLGIEHLHIKLEKDYLEDPWKHFKKGVFLSSCEEPGYLVGRILYMRDQYRKHSNLVLNGVHGRYYKDGIWNEMYVLNLYRAPTRVKTDMLLKYRIMNKDYRADFFEKAFLEIKKGSRGYFRELIEKAIEGHENAPVSIQVDKFDAMHYGTFGNTANSTCDFIMDLVSPLMLRRNVEQGLRMPVQWKWNLSRIQRAVVSRLDRTLAAETTDFANINMLPKKGFSQLAFIATYWLAQSKKFTGKLKSLVGIPVKTQLQKAWDYMPLYESMLRNEELQQHLDYDDMELAPILKKEPWQEFTAGFYKSDGESRSMSDYEHLYKIASVEYFLRHARHLHNSMK